MQQQQQQILREVAHRVFANEFQAAGVELKGEGEFSPSYVLSPLGAKINRCFVVGTLVESSDIGRDGREMYRARVHDGTGNFTIYAGEYQPEAAQVLAALEPGTIVAVVGKARTYKPDDGQMVVSLRPESIIPVDENTRLQWILQTAEHTYGRVKALDAVLGGKAASTDALVGEGVPEIVAEGAFLARDHYGTVDTAVYREMLLDTLRYLEPGAEIPTPEVEESGDFGASGQQQDPSGAEMAPAEDEALEKLVMETIQRLLEEHPEGAPWDEIIDAGTTAGNTEDAVEEALNALIDRGVVYEPILGKLKLA